MKEKILNYCANNIGFESKHITYLNKHIINQIELEEMTSITMLIENAYKYSFNIKAREFLQQNKSTKKRKFASSYIDDFVVLDWFIEYINSNIENRLKLLKSENKESKICNTATSVAKEEKDNQLSLDLFQEENYEK